MKKTLIILFSLISIQSYAQQKQPTKKATPKKVTQAEITTATKNRLVYNVNNYAIEEAPGLNVYLPSYFLRYLSDEPDFENDYFWAKRKLLIANTKKTYFDALLKSLFHITKGSMSFESYLVLAIYMTEQEAIQLANYTKKLIEKENADIRKQHKLDSINNITNESE